MHSSGSFVVTAIERLRMYLDEAILDAKYDNDYLLAHILLPEMVTIMARLNHNRDDPILSVHSITLATDQRYYVLPPNMLQLLDVRQLDDNRHLKKTWAPRGLFNRRGPGWALDGNELRFDPKILSGADWDLYYIANGDYLAHYDTAGGTLANDADGDPTVFTLSASPTVGELDRRESAYVGGVLRITPASGDSPNTIEERVIDSYDASTRKVTVRRPFTDHSAGSGLKYEVAPLGGQALVDCIALRGAMKMGTVRSVSQKKMAFIHTEFLSAFKTLLDNVGNLEGRVGKHYERDTEDHPITGHLTYKGTY
jgi:hypothetical protein